MSQTFLSSLERVRVSHRAVLGAYWSACHEKALELTIHAVVNGGSGDGEVANSIQMRFNAREESEEMPRSWRGNRRREAEASTVHAGLCSSVFLFREGSHKVLYTEFYPILSPGSPRNQGGYGIREAKGRFSHSRGPFIETNGLVRLFLLVPSSSLSCFTLLAIRGLSVSVSLSLSLFLLAFLSLTLECASLHPSLSDFQSRFFLRFFLELRLPRIRQDYLSSAKGRSRLNLKHHLNKREVTARLFPAGKNERKGDRDSLARVPRLY